MFKFWNKTDESENNENDNNDVNNSINANNLVIENAFKGLEDVSKGFSPAVSVKNYLDRWKVWDVLVVFHI